MLNEINQIGGIKNHAKKESIWDTDIKDRDLINLVDKAMIWQDECGESSEDEDDEGDLKEDLDELQGKLQEYEEMVKDL